MEAPPDSAEGRWRHTALAVTLGAVALTLLFSAQEVMRRGPGGGVAVWRPALATNAIDWGSWLLLVPVIARVGSRYRLDASRHVGARAAVWAALGAACSLTQSLVSGVALYELDLLRGRVPIQPLPPLPRFLATWVPATFGFNVIIFCMIAGVFHAVLYHGASQARQLREADLQARLAHARLDALRMQLQPHFLFNALHTISSLMTRDVPTAQQVISALGDLLRASIDHTALEEITLQAELAFVEQYLAIQQARFRHRLSVRMAIAPATRQALVPSLVLQPLVENAIRHGIEPHVGGGCIEVTARREGDRLELSVRDDGSARLTATGDALPPATSGIGLNNLEARLTQLYGASQQIRSGRLATGEFEVVVALPYHTIPSQVPSAPAVA